MSKAAYISEYVPILQHILLTEYIPLLVLNMQTPAYYEKLLGLTSRQTTILQVF